MFKRNQLTAITIALFISLAISWSASAQTTTDEKIEKAEKADDAATDTGGPTSQPTPNVTPPPPPPPAYPPPAFETPYPPMPLPPPPPPFYRTRSWESNTVYSRYRTPWYIGFGIGIGSGWIKQDEQSEIEHQGGSCFTFKVGGVIRPWFLLGGEISSWRYEGIRDDGYDYALQFSHFDAVATFFPIFDQGFYGKVGLGIGMASAEIGYDSYLSSDGGADFKVGLGYELQLSHSLNLGFDFTLASTRYRDATTHDLVGELSLTWY